VQEQSEAGKCFAELTEPFESERVFSIAGLPERSNAFGEPREPVEAGCRAGLTLYPGTTLIMANMHIGELARAAGVNVQTIRFYEREKLLPPPVRAANGYRRYSQSDLDRVLFIRRNHEIGFTLAEIEQLLELHSALAALPRPLQQKPSQVREIIAIGRERLIQVESKIRVLKSMKKQLESLVHHLERSIPVTCPVSSARPRS